MLNETNHLDEILPLKQICLSVRCDALVLAEKGFMRNAKGY